MTHRYMRRARDLWFLIFDILDRNQSRPRAYPTEKIDSERLILREHTVIDLRAQYPTETVSIDRAQSYPTEAIIISPPDGDRERNL